MAANPSQDNDIRKFEEVGTHPAANFLAITEAIRFNQSIGIERKAARLRYLRDRWSDQIAKSPKVKILHNPAPEMSCGIGMFGVVGADASKLVSALQTKHGIYTAYVPHEVYIGIRVTASVYTSPQEIDYFAKAVLTELS
jgi:selenocysteine lyase/cysteine desulfurase